MEFSSLFMNYILHLLHFLGQRVLFLASQEAIFFKPQFFHMKKQVPTKSNRSFRFVISGEGEEGARGWFLRQLKSIWLEVKEETIASNNWVGCNFKPFRGHTFMTSTKNDQLRDPQLPPSAKLNNRSFV